MPTDGSPILPRLANSMSGYDWWLGIYATGIDDLEIHLAFERLADGDNGAIWSEARAVSLMDGDESVIIPPSRVNLMNTTRGGGWKGLVDALSDALPSVEWQEAVAVGVGEAIDTYRVGDVEQELSAQAPEDKGHPFLLEPFLAASGVSVFYGEGGTGKSLIGLAMAVAIAADYPLFGHRPQVSGPVVYFDYEDDSVIHSERLAAILKGAGIELKHPIWHRKLVAKVSQSQASMRRTIQTRGAVACVLDSIGMGRGGNANTAEDTVRMFRALRSLDVPTLAIDHVSKEDKREGEVISPYGSVYTINSARLLWGAVIAEAGSSATKKQLTLKNTKANRVALHKDMGLTLEYRNQRDEEQHTRWLDSVDFKVLDDFGQPEKRSIVHETQQYLKSRTSGSARLDLLTTWFGMTRGQFIKMLELEDPESKILTIDNARHTPGLPVIVRLTPSETQTTM